MSDEERLSALGDVLCAQFTTGLLYRGEEAIGRIRGILHALEPHEGGEDCAVCDADLDGGYYEVLADPEGLVLEALLKAQAVEEFGNRMGGVVQDAAMTYAREIREGAQQHG